MNKKQKQKYYKELKNQYEAKLMSLIGLYIFVILTLFTVVIPLLLLIPIVMLHSTRGKLRIEMLKYENK